MLAATVSTGAIIYINHVVARGNEDRLELEKKIRTEQQRQLDELKNSGSTQEEKIKQLEEKLQSKLAEKARLAAIEASEASKLDKAVKAIIPAPQVAHAASGGCGDWIQQAGITDVANATWLINKESGCRTSAVNPSSGACGIPQALPCSKLGAARGNPVEEIKWMNNYVVARYGSWAGAVAFHKIHNYY